MSSPAPSLKNRMGHQTPGLDAASEVEQLHSQEERARIAKRIYAPILNWETRLIALHSGTASDPLNLNLEVAVVTRGEVGLGLVSQNRVVEYEALSYTWGSTVFIDPVICNGQPFGITSHLDEALRQLRLEGRKRYLWVDALCINQSDLEEKARQIRNPKVVFAKATRVVVWLGVGTTHAKDAIQWLDDLLESERKGKPTLTRPGVTRSQQPRHVMPPTSTSFVNNDDNIIRGLLGLGSRPWAKRSWVVQEVAAAPL
jgi:hypothetical protein